MAAHDVYIARGAALLDEKRPGWEQHVDLRRLYLGNCADCVVGQLFGGLHEDYSTGLGVLDVDGKRGNSPRDYGFACSYDHHAMTDGGLTRAWRRLIRARLARAAAGAQ